MEWVASFQVDHIYWIQSAISEAYHVKARDPPFRIMAHSTHLEGASWALHHQASALQVYKAAMWSFIHTFSKFYKVYTLVSAEVDFGCKV